MSVPNYLEKLLLKYPNNNWDWEEISSNSSITIEFIEKNKNLPWINKNICLNPNITHEFIEKNIGKIPDIFLKLSYNYKLKLEIILIYIEENWDWKTISRNRTDLFNKKIIKYLDWDSLSYNPNLTTKFVEEYIDKEWNWYTFSSNEKFTPEFIEKHIDKNWDICQLSKNRSITIEFIEKYIHNKPSHWYGNWDFKYLSLNPNITPEFIEKYIDKNWSGWYLSSNSNLNIDLSFIEKYSKKIKGLYEISKIPFDDQIVNYDNDFCNPDNIDYKIIKNSNFLSRFHCLTPDLIEKYSEFIDWNFWEKMSSNTFLYNENAKKIYQKNKKKLKLINKILSCCNKNIKTQIENYLSYYLE